MPYTVGLKHEMAQLPGNKLNLHGFQGLFDDLGEIYKTSPTLEIAGLVNICQPSLSLNNHIFHGRSFLGVALREYYIHLHSHKLIHQRVRRFPGTGREIVCPDIMIAITTPKEELG